MKRNWIATISTLAACTIMNVESSTANPRPCRFGFKGVYVTWNKNTSATGTGSFATSAGRASVLPDFNWEVTGEPRTVSIGTDEPFHGGTSMQGSSDKQRTPII